MTEIPTELSDAGWSVEPDGTAMSKTYRFPDFRSAMAWSSVL